MQILNQKFIDDIKNGGKIKLNLGSGNTTHEGMYSVDHIALENVDIVADLNLNLDLIPTNSVKYVYSRHVFEHIANLNNLMSEIHRILVPDGEIEIIVPHFSNTYSFSDPTHVRFFGLYTMNYYSPKDIQITKRKVPDFYTNYKYQIKNIKIEFYTETYFDKIIGKIFNKIVNLNSKTQAFYERRLCNFYHAWQIKYVLKPIK